LKQGEKISNLENASRNFIDYLQKDLEKFFPKEFAKTKQVVQMWSKMLNKRKQPCISIRITIGLIPSNLCTYLMQTSSIPRLYICFGLCWYQSLKRGGLKGK
jgi:hypothetical protein